MKKGFTIIELIVITIIISILATLGFIQYAKTIERARGMEARKVLGQLRQAETAYYQEYNAYTSDITTLITNAPTGCTNTHYFNYSAEGTTTADGSGIALRCTTSGKNPNVDPGYTINVTWSSGAWGGTVGYY